MMTQPIQLLSNLSSKAISRVKNDNTGFDQVMEQSLKSDRSSSEVQGNQGRSSQRDIHTRNSMNRTKTTEHSKATLFEDNTNSIDSPDLESIVTGMVQSVKDAVTQILELSEDELEKMMMGFGLECYFQIDMLQQILLKANGQEDITAILTNEELADKLKQLYNALVNVFEEAEKVITQEEFTIILSQMNNNKTNELKEDMLQKVEKNVVHTQTSDDIGNVPMEVIKVSEANNLDDNSNFGSDKNNNSDRTSDQFNIFLENLVKSTNTQVVEDEFIHLQDIREIADQIIDKIKVIIKPNQTSMEMQLNPEHLGKVNLSIQSKNGVLTAQFVVQNQMAKEAIEGQMIQLRDTLEQQGLKVEAIEVTVSNMPFQQSNEAGTNQQQGNRQSKKTISLEEANQMLDNEIVLETTIPDDTMSSNGSSIDYTA